MGRQTNSKAADLAYIAGFLDGDGSVMCQLKRRKDSPRGKRLMFTVCFYQDTRHEKPLFWIKKILGIGYISRRNDGMTELRINGYEQVERILRGLYSYLRFKKDQVTHIFQILEILSKRSIRQLTKEEKRIIVNNLIAARKQAYQSGQKTIGKLERDLKEIMSL